jgi:hypothetical protein
LIIGAEMCNSADRRDENSSEGFERARLQEIILMAPSSGGREGTGGSSKRGRSILYQVAAATDAQDQVGARNLLWRFDSCKSLGVHAKL